MHVIVCFVAAALAGCAAHSPPGVDLRFEDRCSWRPGCALPPPGDFATLAVGARDGLWLWDNHPDTLTIAAADPSVVSLWFTSEPSGGFGTVEGLRPGTTELVVTDAEGLVVEARPIEVGVVDRIEAWDLDGEETVVFFVDGEDDLYFRIFDASGARMRGYGAVSYDGRGVDLVTPAEWVLMRTAVGDPAPTTPEAVRVHATVLGPGSIVAQAGDAALTLPLEVVDGSAVSQLVVGEAFDLFGVTVVADARTASGQRIRGIRCAWDVTSGGFPVSDVLTRPASAPVFGG